MSTHVLLDARIVIAGVDCSGDHNVIDLPWMISTLAAGCFGSRVTKYIAGAEDWTLTGQGYQSYGAGNISDLLRTRKGLPDTVFTVAPGEADAGTPPVVFTFTGVLLEIVPMGGEWNTLHAFRWRARPSAGEPLLLGYSLGLSPSTPITATGPTAGITLPALGASDTLRAVLSVVAPVSGSLVVTIESAPAGDFAAPTVRGTFPAVTAPASLALDIAGPVTDTHWRGVFTVSGGTPSFPAFLSLGIL